MLLPTSPPTAGPSRTASSTGCQTRSPSAWPRRGLGAGDVLALVLHNGPEYLFAYLAAAKLGAVTAGVNDRLAPSERAGILEIAPAAPRPRLRRPRSRRLGRRGGRRRVDRGRRRDQVPRRGRGAGRAGVRSRRSRRDHVHVGDDGSAEGRAVLRTASCSSSPRPTSATPGDGGARLRRDVDRAPRLHDQAAGQPPARRHQLHHAALARRRGAAHLGRATNDHDRGRARAVRAHAAPAGLRRVRPRQRRVPHLRRRAASPPTSPRRPASASTPRSSTRYSCTEAGIGLGTAFDDPARGRGRERRSPASRRRARAPRRRRPAGAGGRGRRRSACAPPP